MSTTTALPVDYPLPVATDVPANQAAWSLDPQRCALLVHDAQRYFLRTFAPATRTVLLTRLERLVATARAAGVPVLFTAQPGRMTPQDRGLLQDFWGEGMTAAAEDRDIHPAVAPRLDETVLTKWRYSAFFASDLEDRLRAAGRDQLLIGGVFTHLGVLFTATDAMSRGVEAFVVGDATGDLSREEHLLGLRLAAMRCASVTWTADALHDLTGPRVAQS